MAAHWGDLPVIIDMDSGIAKIERDQMTKPRSMDVEGPRLQQPSNRHYPPTNDPLPAEKFQIDPVTLHTIQLLQHAQKLRTMIAAVQQQQESIKKEEGEVTYMTAPPIPLCPAQPMRHVPQNPLHYLPKDTDSDFARGKGEALPVIDDTVNRKLLRRSVAALCAHAGFDGSSDSVLDTLTDITNEYYFQFVKKLRSAVDTSAIHGQQGFPDVMERVFHESGLGSIRTVFDFYQSRVLDYHRNTTENCQQLMTAYEKLTQPSSYKPTETLTLIRIKEEPYSDIQFPTLDDSDEISDAEQLLQLEGLSGFEITVEHEPSSGLTTEVDSKWQQGVKCESNAENRISGLEPGDDPGSIWEHSTPQTPPLSDGGDSLQDPSSLSDIMSPPPLLTGRPSQAMKKRLK